MPAEQNKELVDFYNENGYAVIPDFLTPEEVGELQEDVKNILSSPDLEQTRPGRVGELHGTQYLVDSIDKASLWFEADAINEKGQLAIPIERAVHKIAHGAHLRPVGRRTTFSDKMKELIRTVSGFEAPTVIQGMFLLKQPRIGEERTAHRDETYLRTTPEGKVVGIWIALDDATTTNGCLEFITGTHKGDNHVTYFFERSKGGEGPLIQYTGHADYLDNPMKERFVVAPMKKGSLVLIHGLVIHKSEANRSDSPRAAFSFHVYEKKETEWHATNWCQETSSYKMLPLYSTSPD